MLILYIADVERDLGMKKLSQEEAAKILEDMKVKTEIPKAAITQWKRNTAIDMAIESLRCSESPNSSPLINRQTAIDALHDEIVRRRISENTNDDVTLDEFDTEAILRQLPSAQPEIVCCKDCKHIRRWRSEEAAQKFGQIYECAYGVFRVPHADDFCSKAERREDE